MKSEPKLNLPALPDLPVIIASTDPLWFKSPIQQELLEYPELQDSSDQESLKVAVQYYLIAEPLDSS